MGDTEFTIFQKALQKDKNWAWSWHCNIAMTIKDATGISHASANEAAALLMSHMFSIDVTNWSEYQDIISRTDSSHIDILVSGGKSNSGAVTTARALSELLEISGHQVNLDINNTIGFIPDAHNPGVGSVFNVKAKEPIDIEKYLEHLNNKTEQEEIPSLQQAKLILNPPSDELDDDSCEDDYDDCEDNYEDSCDCGDDTSNVANCFGLVPDQTGAPADKPSHGSLTINATIPSNIDEPTQVIDGLVALYPGANVNVNIEFDSDSGDAVRRAHYLLESAKFVDLVDPQVAADAPRGLVETSTERWLANDEDRRKCYLFTSTGDEERFCLLHVETPEDFNPTSITESGWVIHVAKDIGSVAGILTTLGVSERYATDIFINNERWLNTYGEKPRKRVIDGDFTLWNIPQSAIPRELCRAVEDSWMAFQSVDNLPELAEILGDPTIVIKQEDYVSVTRNGGLVVLEHPRVGELFIKYLRHQAQTWPALAAWFDSFE